MTTPEGHMCVRTLAIIKPPAYDQGKAFLEPLHVAVDDQLDQIYITMLYRLPDLTEPDIPGFLAVLDATNLARKPSYIPLQHPPRDVAVDPLTHKVFVTHNTSPGRVSVINGTEVTFSDGPFDDQPFFLDNIAPVVVPLTINNAYGLAINPQNRRVYVWGAGVNGTTLDADQPNASSPSELSIPSALGPSPDRIAVDANNRIYVPSRTSETNAVLYVLNGSTPPPVVQLSVASGPSDVAIDPTNKRIYVANFDGDNSVSVLAFDPADPDALPTLQSTVAVIGLSPVVRVDPALNLAYVTTRNGPSLEEIGAGMNVIDGASAKLFKLPPDAPPPDPETPLGAWGLDVSVKSHRVYIANARARTISVVEVTRGPSAPVWCLSI